MANCVEYPLVLHGILAAGQVVTPVNALYTATGQNQQPQPQTVASRIITTFQRPYAAIAEAPRRDVRGEIRLHRQPQRIR